MGRFDQAVAEFRRVIVLDPKHAEAYNYVGYMFAEKGVRLDEAERLIQKALELEPENGYYIDSLGWAYYQQGRYSATPCASSGARWSSRAARRTR